MVCIQQSDDGMVGTMSFAPCCIHFVAVYGMECNQVLAVRASW